MNNGNIDLLRVEDNGDKEDNQDKERKCYTAKKPFYIKLLRHKRRQEVQLRSSKKAKSPATNTKASKGKGKSAKKKH